MSLDRRLDVLERTMRYRRPRWIVVAINGNLDDDGGGLDAFLKELDVQDDELVVCVARFVDTEGLPRIASVSFN